MKDYFANLFSHNCRANENVVDSICSADVPGKATAIMSHVINAGIIWLARMKGTASSVAVWQEYEKSDLPSKQAAADNDLLAFIDSADDEILSSIVNYSNSRGETFSNTVSEILTHLAIHSAYHRGQIILMIKGIVDPLPQTDYILYKRNLKQ